MTVDQGMVFGVLLGTLALFVWGRWRYDLVALLALVVATVSGAVPVGEAFAGFVHPAVITVAAVLVISRGLARSGLVDALVGQLERMGHRLTVQLLALSSLAAVLSAFMSTCLAFIFQSTGGDRCSASDGNLPLAVNTLTK